MKFPSLITSVLCIALASFSRSSATELLSRQSQDNCAGGGGLITALRYQLQVSPNGRFPFKYTPCAWCIRGTVAEAVLLTVWLTHRPVDNSHLNPTGGITPGPGNMVLWKYGQYTQPVWEGAWEAGDQSPKTLTMPDFTSLGIVPNAIWLSVIEIAHSCQTGRYHSSCFSRIWARTGLILATGR
ncbi:hypothetical protein BDV98DRAFT_581382 [Pterulicium gracile]|uniref:Uncharacterized protein n=1 Tax=Pterulicium gracile TaxID=1884261 RepID=A0A5C3QPV6_9AGAR|nr:hypothetical protein BDV98DRAFT_581382 [Pterula gracilis]